jgi:AraC family transcriptional activator of pobA
MEQYLFHQLRSVKNGEDQTANWHHHDFWQVDFIHTGSGSLSIRQGNQLRQMDFRAGSVIIIPAGWMHKFAYDQRPNSWLSVKFTSSAEVGEAVIFANEKIMEHTASILGEALSPHLMSRSATMAVVNAALSVLCGFYTMNLQLQKSDTSEFVHRIKEFVYANAGRDLRLDDIGEYMDCTGKHAALRFHKETGETLKNFLDQSRADVAARIMRTSSKSLSEIAQRLDFRDVYAFSRFFKRVTGSTLSDFRNPKPDSR